MLGKHCLGFTVVYGGAEDGKRLCSQLSSSVYSSAASFDVYSPVVLK